MEFGRLNAHIEDHDGRTSLGRSQTTFIYRPDHHGCCGRNARLGVLVDIGEQFPGFIDVLEIARLEDSSPPDLETYPQPGQDVTARIVGFTDSNHEIYLTTR